MDTKEFKEKVENLSTNIDELEEALAPLLKQDLADTAAKLPVLDTAKLNVLSSYAIESLLFSILKLHGTDAKAHPVFTELTRVKQYFQKIEAAEAKTQGKTGPAVSLDKAAANRFIKHALAGNDRSGGPAQTRPNTKITFKDDDGAALPSPQRTSPRATKRGSDAPLTKKRQSRSRSSPASTSTSSSSDSEAEPEEKVSNPTTEEGQEPAAANPTLEKKRRHAEMPLKSSVARKKKSDRAPRDGGEVFRDLLSRPKKKAKQEDD